MECSIVSGWNNGVRQKLSGEKPVGLEEYKAGRPNAALCVRSARGLAMVPPHSGEAGEIIR
jgi:hypothetical protein